VKVTFLGTTINIHDGVKSHPSRTTTNKVKERLQSHRLDWVNWGRDNKKSKRAINEDENEER